MKPPRGSQAQQGLVFMGLGFELLAVMLTGLYMGNWLDTQLKTKGLITVVLSILLLAAWIWHVILLLQRTMKNGDKK